MATISLTLQVPSIEVSEFSYNYEDDLLPRFRKQEIQLGSLLGQGNFCQTFDVKRMKLSSRCEQTSPPQEMARESLVLYSRKVPTTSRVAIKKLNHKLLDKSEEKLDKAVANLVFEANMLSKLNHANIVHLFGLSLSFHEQNENVFMLTEQLSETLEHKLEDWRIDTKKGYTTEKTFYAYQIASALDYLHTRRIIFRDLNPRKIGFNGEIVKLCDFSDCIELSSTERLDKRARKERVYELPAATGTPRYMSPEMLMKEAYNEQTDVYSWAMVFHEMLTLERMYMDHSMTQLCVKVCVMKERPDLSGCKIPKTLEALLRRSWESNINTRVSMASVCKVLESRLQN